MLILYAFDGFYSVAIIVAEFAVCVVLYLALRQVLLKDLGYYRVWLIPVTLGNTLALIGTLLYFFTLAFRGLLMENIYRLGFWLRAWPAPSCFTALYAFTSPSGSIRLRPLVRRWEM